jgi:hypothetical protein
MYTFTPMTEEEISSYNLMEKGIYDFEVIKSIRKVSKSGNPMAELQLNVWDKAGKQHTIFDYLVFSSIPLNIKKVKHFCDATGLAEKYKQGSIPEELERFSGKVEIGVQDEQPKEGGGFYPKKNIVLDYIVIDKAEIKYESTPADNFINDEIPF